MAWCTRCGGEYEHSPDCPFRGFPIGPPSDPNSVKVQANGCLGSLVLMGTALVWNGFLRWVAIALMLVLYLWHGDPLGESAEVFWPVLNRLAFAPRISGFHSPHVLL
jgi:hypothetical protein